MRYLLLILSLMLLPLRTSQAEVSIGVGVELPGVEIGIQVPAYPRLVRVPGHPVYYAPHVDVNFFFFDGLYWVFSGDNWYVSGWYDGPWELIEPLYVPVYLLRVPVRYYRRPPPYFHGWHVDAPPRWGEHWGHDWEGRRGGWDKWEPRSSPPPAPLPGYQRKYGGDRYPHQPEQQRSIRSERYHYQPRDEFTRRHYEAPGKRPHYKERERNQ